MGTAKNIEKIIKGKFLFEEGGEEFLVDCDDEYDDNDQRKRKDRDLERRRNRNNKFQY